MEAQGYAMETQKQTDLRTKVKENELRLLRRENDRLKIKLKEAVAIIELQKKRPRGSKP